MASENIVDVVEELKKVVSDLKLILYGDEKARINGLLVDFMALQRDVAAMKADVHKLQLRRPAISLWIVGYISFLAGIGCGVVAILNQIDTYAVFGIPAAVAVFLAGMFLIVACFLFVAGFGWIDGRQ